MDDRSAGSPRAPPRPRVASHRLGVHRRRRPGRGRTPRRAPGRDPLGPRRLPAAAAFPRSTSTAARSSSSTDEVCHLRGRDRRPGPDSVVHRGRRRGQSLARRVSRQLVTYLQRPGNQAQMSMFTAPPAARHVVGAGRAGPHRRPPGRQTCRRPRSPHGRWSASVTCPGCSSRRSA